tara:strand:- start:1570 stop:2247 length:678 start_codon:yes stop_codon:yes gene_type:complete
VVTVFLEGQIAAELEKKWHLSVRTVADALRAIHANTGNFLGSIIKHQNHYVIIVDGKPLESAESLYKKVRKSIHIVPVLAGAVVFWPAFIKAIATVTAFLAKYSAWYAAAGTGVQTAIAALVVIGGYALISYGIHLLVESIIGGPDDPDAISTTSYVFQGPQNVTAQGSPVPIAYGRLMAGSKVISASISSVDKSNDSFLRKNMKFSSNHANLKEGGAMVTRQIL